MRTLGLALLGLLILWPARAAQHERREHRREEKRERRPKPARAPRPPKRAAVPAPKPVRDPRRILRDRRGPPAPPLDENGRPVAAAPTTAAPNHALVERRGPAVKIIERRERRERQQGRYYWHHEGALRYCHYYDAWGAHWYGFYAGRRFYWTRRWADRWWWYEPAQRRWVYWHEGYWWWQDPAAPGPVYVFVDGRYEPRGVTVALTPSPPPQADASTGPVRLYYSDDGARMAQIVGDDHGAYLYDSSVSGTPSFLAELSTGAASVRFSSATASEVLVERLDGSFAVFDADGKPQ